MLVAIVIDGSLDRAGWFSSHSQNDHNLQNAFNVLFRLVTEPINPSGECLLRSQRKSCDCTTRNRFASDRVASCLTLVRITAVAVRRRGDAIFCNICEQSWWAVRWFSEQAWRMRIQNKVRCNLCQVQAGRHTSTIRRSDRWWIARFSINTQQYASFPGLSTRPLSRTVCGAQITPRNDSKTGNGVMWWL